MTRTAARRPGWLLVVGQDSFVARHLLAACDEPLTAVGHEAIDRPDLLDGIDRVIDCARHPLLGSEDYRVATMVVDPRLAERIAGRDIAYVMLSSRRVHARSTQPLVESDPTVPQDLYGRHKQKGAPRGGLTCSNILPSLGRLWRVLRRLGPQVTELQGAWETLRPFPTAASVLD